MVHTNFKNGFEKLAFDYNKYKRLLTSAAKTRASRIHKGPKKLQKSNVGTFGQFNRIRELIKKQPSSKQRGYLLNTLNNKKRSTLMQGHKTIKANRDAIKVKKARK